MKTTCPRRMYEWGPWEQKENLDTWTQEKNFRTCSFCGSVHPDDVLTMIKNGEIVGPTDKSYKMYIGDNKVYFQHFDERHREEFINLINEGNVRFDYPNYFYVLPFFVRRMDPLEKLVRHALQEIEEE